MADHTPGPWTHYDLGPDQKPGPYIIAQTVNVLDNGYLSPGCTVTCGKNNPNGGTYWPAMPFEEARANARLIAAAPQLLAACKRVLTFEQMKNLLGDESRAASYLAMMDDVRAAITDAERTTP